MPPDFAAVVFTAVDALLVVALVRTVVVVVCTASECTVTEVAADVCDATDVDDNAKAWCGASGSSFAMSRA